MFGTTPYITLETAKKMMAAAQAKASENSGKVAITIVTELEGSGRRLPLFGAGYGESNAVPLESICWCFGLNAQ